MTRDVLKGGPSTADPGFMHCAGILATLDDLSLDAANGSVQLLRAAHRERNLAEARSGRWGVGLTATKMAIPVMHSRLTLNPQHFALGR
jgi:hypothetical protein